MFLSHHRTPPDVTSFPVRKWFAWEPLIDINAQSITSRAYVGHGQISFVKLLKLFSNQKIQNRPPETPLSSSRPATHTVVAGYLMLYKCPAGSVLSYDDISLMKLWLLTPPTHSQQFVTICLGLSPQSLAAGTHLRQPAVSPSGLKFSSNIWFYV